MAGRRRRVVNKEQRMVSVRAAICGPSSPSTDREDASSLHIKHVTRQRRGRVVAGVTRGKKVGLWHPRGCQRRAIRRCNRTLSSALYGQQTVIQSVVCPFRTLTYYPIINLNRWHGPSRSCWVRDSRVCCHTATVYMYFTGTDTVTSLRPDWYHRLYWRNRLKASAPNGRRRHGVRITFN